MTPSEIDELERLHKAATPGPWWFDAGGPDETCSLIGGDNREIAEFPFYAPHRNKANEDVVVALHKNAPALIDAARDLLWHEDRHGTRAEQEAEDAALDADLARIDALSDEECIAELATEGIDYDASRKKFDVMLKVCAERADLKREVERLRAFVPRWRMKRYSPTAVTWRLFVGDTAIPDTGLHPADAGRVFASGDGEGYPDLPTAARAVCTRLGIPYVPVEVDDG